MAEEPGGALRKELRNFSRVKVTQQEDVWCWAACAEMIHHWNGSSLKQKDIVDRITGRPDENGEASSVETATRYQICLALAPTMTKKLDKARERLTKNVVDALMEPDEYKRREARLDLGFDAVHILNGQRKASEMNPTEMVEEIAAGQPLMAALTELNPDGSRSELGHAYVVYGLVFDTTAVTDANDFFKGAAEAIGMGDVFGAGQAIDDAASLDKYDVKQVLLVDPWDASEKRLDYADFIAQADFVVSRRQAESFISSIASL